MLILLITLTTAGADSGPFDLYSNVDGFEFAFESGISKDDLLSGYLTTGIPDGTTTVRVTSAGSCTNYIDITVETSSTTTTTTIIL